MPIKFEIDYAADLTRFTITGAVGFDDIVTIFNSYLKAGITSLILYDISRGTLKSITSKQANQIIGWIVENSHKRPAGSKTAIVLAKDTDHKTLSFFQRHTEVKEMTWEAEFFHSLFEAYEWLTKSQKKV